MTANKRKELLRKWLYAEQAAGRDNAMYRYLVLGTTYQYLFRPNTVRRALRKPSWADSSVISAIYAVAAAWREAGEDVVVDHIVPVRGALVSGLHVESNLTVLPRRDNAKKSNRFAVA